MTLYQLVETASFTDFMMFSMWFWLANAAWGILAYIAVLIFKSIFK